MGAKTWMLVYADENAAAALRGGHQLSRDATLQLAKNLFPKDKLALIGEGRERSELGEVRDLFRGLREHGGFNERPRSYDRGKVITLTEGASSMTLQ